MKAVQNISMANKIEELILKHEQVNAVVYHTVHSGVYTRSLRVNKGTVIAGALIKIPTTVIVSGKCNVLVGDETYAIDGYEVITASANRKQVFVAIEDTVITMIFKTEHKDIESIEKQFTDEYDKLMRDEYQINITED